MRQGNHKERDRLRKITQVWPKPISPERQLVYLSSHARKMAALKQALETRDRLRARAETPAEEAG